MSIGRKRTGRLARLALLLLIPFWSVRAARAEPPTAPSAVASPPPAETVLVAPKVISSTEIVAPPGTGDAVVVLALTVNADGALRGLAPSWALSRWRVLRHRRRAGGVSSRQLATWEAGAALIRFEVTFHAPAPAPTTTATGEGAVAHGAPAGTPNHSSGEATPAFEVEQELRPAPECPPSLVTESRPDPGNVRRSVQSDRGDAGSDSDRLGILRSSSRGAPPGNVGYFIDGVRVPYLYHVGLGPSVIHPGLVDRVDLYPGGYPARFGRFAGGIVSGETTAPQGRCFTEKGISASSTSERWRKRALMAAEAPYSSADAIASYTAAILSLIRGEHDSRLSRLSDARHLRSDPSRSGDGLRFWFVRPSRSDDEQRREHHLRFGIPLPIGPSVRSLVQERAARFARR